MTHHLHLQILVLQSLLLHQPLHSILVRHYLRLVPDLTLPLLEPRLLAHHRVALLLRRPQGWRAHRGG